MDVETRAMRSHEDAQPHDVNDENQTIIRRFTDELEDDQPNDSLTSSLKLAVDEKDKELELAKPWRSQYEAPIPVYVSGIASKRLQIGIFLIQAETQRMRISTFSAKLLTSNGRISDSDWKKSNRLNWKSGQSGN